MINEKQLKKVNIGIIERPIPPIREFFDEAELSRLTNSIRENGLLVPLLVREKNGKYEVIDGDRRLKSCWDAGLREIPVMVVDIDDRETHIQRMLANKDREDTDPVSEAKYIARLIHENIFTSEEYATKCGYSIAWVEDRLTIAEMPEYMQQALATKQVSLGVCLELNQITDDNARERYFREAMRSGMTIHAAKLNRLTINETIDSLREAGEQIVEEKLPEIQIIPKVRCELTGDVLPLPSTRMIRVGIENYEKFRREMGI